MYYAITFIVCELCSSIAGICSIGLNLLNGISWDLGYIQFF